MGLDLDDVGHPDLVGRIHLELPIQGVGRDEGRLPTVSSRAALVADLGGDARKASQPGDPVLGNPFPLIPQIVGQLAIAINFAAVGPSLPDQLRLAYIIARPQT